MRGVALCYFPYPDAPELPSDKLHPCLIVTQFQHHGRVYAIVVYGTSKMHTRHENRGVLCVRPEHRISWPMAESNVITYFVGTDVAILPWATTEFFPNKDKLGAVNPQAINAYEFNEFNNASRRPIKQLIERFIATGKYGRL